MSNNHKDSDSDEEALWIVPGRDDLEEASALSAVSPWRTPAVLRQSRDVRVKALLRAARGPSLFGIVDLKVLAWLSSHLAVPLLLHYIDEDVRRILVVALGGKRQWPRDEAGGDDGGGGGGGSGGPLLGLGSDRLQALALLALMAAALWLFGSLYCSDPGWIHAASPAVDLEPRSQQQQQQRPPRPPCPLCGEVPSLRSHHDKHTGQCVHKHDHHCWVLSATIGDLNHRRFVSLLAVEASLLTWLQLRCLPLALSCTLSWGGSGLAAGAAAAQALSGSDSGPTLPLPHPHNGDGNAAAAAACPRVTGWGRLVALWAVVGFGLAGLVLVAQLLALHAYLAATNQTTLELIKGPRLPYMAAAYAALPISARSQCGGGGQPGSVLGDRGQVSLGTILRHHWQGTAPPRPFDEGLWRNLSIFFAAPKPHPYRHR